MIAKSSEQSSRDETVKLRAALKDCHRALQRCEEMLRNTERELRADRIRRPAPKARAAMGDFR
jgi:hypothetical protein